MTTSSTKPSGSERALKVWTYLKVHGELVSCHPAELQDNAVEVFGRNQLEVFDAGHGNTAVEVEHVGSNLRQAGNPTGVGWSRT